jgi:gamma-glutamyltranspeptidase / glutathione hydrolase
LQILDPPAKTARSRNGMVAASTPYASAAGAQMLEQGGNAVDAAAAAAFALMVTDPPMTSLGGRSQTVIALADGRVFGVDGATQAPSSVTPLEDPAKPRTGYKLVPVPANPAALAHMVASYGKLRLAQVIEPALRLAEDGFAVTPQVAAIWTSERRKLAANAGAAASYLKPDGSPYFAGETFRHPKLAALLRRLSAEGPDSFYRGATGERIAADVRAGGGFVELTDLAAYKPGPGQIVRANYRGYEILSMGRHGWGNTMGEMLQILAQFPVGRGEPSAQDVELLARVIAQALEDRPQFLGTLRPKPDGLPLDQLSDPKFAARRAAEIRARMGKPLAASGALAQQDHDTTHLSVVDREGNAVALTTSIGPRFGSGVATPDLGFLYGYSYNMRSAPAAGQRDLTEMSPTLVRRNGRVILAIGAAGSERIPAAILQALSYHLDRGYELGRALAAPRVFAAGNKARLHETFPAEVAAHLRRLGFELELRDPGVHQHLGIVHAVSYDAKTGEFTGAADPVYDGAAVSPGK